jgi:hypothetical protein
VFEFHGWATIRDRASWKNDEEALFTNDPAEQTLSALRKLMQEFEGVSNHVTDLRPANGEWHLWIAGFHNHRDPQVTAFYEAVAALAPGSYGLLYVHDDEADGERELWIPWVMKRGQVSREHDPFLSPRIPTTEDYWAHG